MTAFMIFMTVLTADPIGAGDHSRSIEVDGLSRSYLCHVPKSYQRDKPAPVVLVFHGAGMNAAMMVSFCGMNETSEEAGFIVIYPNGTGLGPFQTFNAGGLLGKMAEGKADDVRFVSELLDDIASVVNVDPKRVYATGMSNGGMMCYRLAAELSHRIAAVAPVSGTMAIDDAKPLHPIPILHLHGTADQMVPYAGPDKRTPKFLTFKSVAETIRVWAKINKCEAEPMVEKLEDKTDDGTSVTKTSYSPGKGGAEVVLLRIEGGGHTWPGKQLAFGFLGKSTTDISANEVIWEFFKRHSNLEAKN